MCRERVSAAAAAGAPWPSAACGPAATARRLASQLQPPCCADCKQLAACRPTPPQTRLDLVDIVDGLVKLHGLLVSAPILQAVEEFHACIQMPIGGWSQGHALLLACTGAGERRGCHEHANCKQLPSVRLQFGPMRLPGCAALRLLSGPLTSSMSATSASWIS